MNKITKAIIFIYCSTLFITCTNNLKDDEMIKNRNSLKKEHQSFQLHYINNGFLDTLLSFEERVVLEGDSATVSKKWYIESGFSIIKNDTFLMITASLNPSISLDSINYMIKGSFKLNHAYSIIWDYKNSSGYGLYSPETLPQLPDSIIKGDYFYSDNMHYYFNKKYRVSSGKFYNVGSVGSVSN